MTRTLLTLSLALALGCGDSSDGAAPVAETVEPQDTAGADVAAPDDPGTTPDPGAPPEDDGPPADTGDEDATTPPDTSVEDAAPPDMSVEDTAPPGDEGPLDTGGPDADPNLCIPPGALAYCTAYCDTTLDCAAPPLGGAFDVDNYLCVDHACVYLGCLSDEECDTTFQGLGFVCRDNAFGATTCVQGCAQVNDCTFDDGATEGAFDLDNYACEDGGCVWTGCNNDTECLNTLSVGSKCIQVPGSPIPGCQLTCSTAADCVGSDPEGGAYGEDNYLCQDGLCLYLGCGTNSQCAASNAQTTKCTQAVNPTFCE